MLPANLLELSATSSFVYFYLLPISLFTITPNTLTKLQSKRLNQTNLFSNKRPLDKRPTNLINPLKAYYIISLKVNSWRIQIKRKEKKRKEMRERGSVRVNRSVVLR
jgi:hypothetical protein